MHSWVDQRSSSSPLHWVAAQGTGSGSTGRPRRRARGRAATPAARAPGPSRRSACARTRRQAGATRSAGTASSPPTAAATSSAAPTASPTSASAAARRPRPRDWLDAGILLCCHLNNTMPAAADRLSPACLWFQSSSVPSASCSGWGEEISGVVFFFF